MTPPDDITAELADLAPTGPEDLAPSVQQGHGTAANDHAIHGLLPPVEIMYPTYQSAPVVFASPHSGRDYPTSFVQSAKLDPLTLRRSEDAFVDELFRAAPKFGAPLVKAHFPRAYVDANREAFELDPAMFDGPLPTYVKTQSSRISAGLGTVARMVANGENIYHDRLSFAEVEQRIQSTHTPYHQALSETISHTLERFGGCLLIDCHSMPSQAASSDRKRDGLADIVIGDCHGTSASGDLVTRIERRLMELGFKVTRNRPYAGGYTTRHYGRPREGLHAVQIELNRGLYLDEARISRLPNMISVEKKLSRLIEDLCSLSPANVAPAR